MDLAQNVINEDYNHFEFEINFNEPDSYQISYLDLYEKRKAAAAAIAGKECSGIAQIISTDSTAPIKNGPSKNCFFNIADELEKKYGKILSIDVKNKKRKICINDYKRSHLDYDIEDDFIDDSEFTDDILDPDVTTKEGGFYVNTGRAEGVVDSEIDALLKTKWKLIDEIASNGQEDEEGAVVDEMETDVVSKDRREKDAVIQTPTAVQLDERVPIDLTAVQEVRSLEPNVERPEDCEIIEATSQPKFKSNDAESNEEGSLVLKKSDPIPVETETVIRLVEMPIHKVEPPIHIVKTPIHKVELPIHKVEPPIHKVEPPIHNVETPIHKVDPVIVNGCNSDSKSAVELEIKELITLALPTNIIPEALQIIEILKTRGSQTDINVRNFFDSQTCENLVQLDRLLFASSVPNSQRVAIFKYLEQFVPSKKSAIVKKLRNIKEEKCNKRLSPWLKALSTEIHRAMPQAREIFNRDRLSYEEKVKAWRQHQEQTMSTAHCSLNSQSDCSTLIDLTTNSEGETNDSMSVHQSVSSTSSSTCTPARPDDVARLKRLVKPVMPRRVYPWTAEIKAIYSKIISIKWASIHEIRCKGTDDENMRKFCQSTLLNLWPENWMSMAVLMKKAQPIIDGIKSSSTVRSDRNATSNEKSAPSTAVLKQPIESSKKVVNCENHSIGSANDAKSNVNKFKTNESTAITASNQSPSVVVSTLSSSSSSTQVTATLRSDKSIHLEEIFQTFLTDSIRSSSQPSSSSTPSQPITARAPNLKATVYPSNAVMKTSSHFVSPPIPRSLQSSSSSNHSSPAPANQMQASNAAVPVGRKSSTNQQRAPANVCIDLTQQQKQQQQHHRSSSLLAHNLLASPAHQQQHQPGPSTAPVSRHFNSGHLGAPSCQSTPCQTKSSSLSQPPHSPTPHHLSLSANRSLHQLFNLAAEPPSDNLNIQLQELFQLNNLFNSSFSETYKELFQHPRSRNPPPPPPPPFS